MIKATCNNCDKPLLKFGDMYAEAIGGIYLGSVVCEKDKLKRYNSHEPVNVRVDKYDNS